MFYHIERKGKKNLLQYSMVLQHRNIPHTLTQNLRKLRCLKKFANTDIFIIFKKVGGLEVSCFVLLFHIKTIVLLSC